MLRPVIVVENALSPEEVAACNAAIDASWDVQYTDGGGDTHPCRSGGHQSRAFFEMRGMLEWDKPHCLPFRNLLGPGGSCTRTKDGWLWFFSPPH